MDKWQVLQLEYEQCGEDTRALAASSWQAVYVFLSAVVVALAVVIGQFVDRPWQKHDGLMLGLAAIAAAAGTALAWALQQINRRQAWVQRIAYARMRSIEWSLGMRKNIFVDIPDRWPARCCNPDWHALSEEERRFLEALQDRLADIRPRLVALKVIAWVTWFIMAGWIVLFLSELSIVLWNSVHG